MEKFINAIFDFQVNVKVYHWSTKSYPRHKASDEIVDEVQNLGDKFVEVYTGKYGRDKFLPLGNKNAVIKVLSLTDASIIKYLDDFMAMLTVDLPKFLKNTDTDLLNIRDELLGAVAKTKYLFTLS